MRGIFKLFCLQKHVFLKAFFFITLIIFISEI